MRTFKFQSITINLVHLKPAVKLLFSLFLLTFSFQNVQGQQLREYYCTGDGYLFGNSTWLNGRVGYEVTNGKLYVSTPDRVYESSGKTFFGADLYTNQGKFNLRCEGRSYPLRAELELPNGNVLPARVLISDYDSQRSVITISKAISLRYEEWGKFIVTWSPK